MSVVREVGDLGEFLEPDLRLYAISRRVELRVSGSLVSPVFSGAGYFAVDVLVGKFERDNQERKRFGKKCELAD